jgi:sugar lactone lactonase YvrE
VKYSRQAFVALLASTVLAAGAAVAAADRGHDRGGKTTERLFTLQPDPAANPEGITFDKRSKAFFVSITAGGAIYRGTLGSNMVAPFIPGTDGGSAVGIHNRRGLLYVAGGATGKITVYDIGSKRVVANFHTGSGGFLNDLVVTKHGDVFVTDSFRPTLWHVTADQVRAGGGTPEALDVSADIPFTAGQFNLNGIVAASSHTLIVVQSNTGKLFRITFDEDHTTSIDEITGVSVPGGDGLLLDEGRLVVVQGGPTAQLSVVKLHHGARRGEIRDTITSDLLEGPSTVDRAKDRAKDLYLVVNADFATSTRPFTVAGLLRDQGDDRKDDDRGHGAHGHH